MIPMKSGDAARGSLMRSAGFVAGFLVLGLLVFLAIKFFKQHQTVAPVEKFRNELVFKEGRLYETNGTMLFAGFVCDKYDDGKLKSRSAVSNGLLEGLSQGWWTNGALQVTEIFSNGISNGIRTKFYPGGSTQSVANIVAGQMQGLFRTWHENGKPAEQVTLTNGVADGLAYSYHPDGSLKARVRLDHGNVLEQKFWEPGAASAVDVGRP